MCFTACKLSLTKAALKFFIHFFKYENEIPCVPFTAFSLPEQKAWQPAAELVSWPWEEREDDLRMCGADDVQSCQTQTLARKTRTQLPFRRLHNQTQVYTDAPLLLFQQQLFQMASFWPANILNRTFSSLLKNYLYIICKGYTPFTVITKCRLHSPCCTTHPWSSLICPSVAKSCPTLGDPMDCTSPGSSVLHYFLVVHLIPNSFDSNSPSPIVPLPMSTGKPQLVLFTCASASLLLYSRVCYIS